MEPADLVAELRRAREDLHLALSKVPEDRRDEPPARGTWAAAQVLEHLLMVERAITVLMRRAFRALEPEELGPWDPGGIDAAKLEGLTEGTGIESPDRSRPTGEVSAAEALPLLEESRRALFALMDEIAPFDVTGAEFDHFVFGPLNLGEWALFLAGHERRHARQLERIATALQGRDA